jgi:hypothetical protein
LGSDNCWEQGLSLAISKCDEAEDFKLAGWGNDFEMPPIPENVAALFLFAAQIYKPPEDLAVVLRD